MPASFATDELLHLVTGKSQQLKYAALLGGSSAHAVLENLSALVDKSGTDTFLALIRLNILSTNPHKRETQHPL